MQKKFHHLAIIGLLLTTSDLSSDTRDINCDTLRPDIIARALTQAFEPAWKQRFEDCVIRSNQRAGLQRVDQTYVQRGLADELFRQNLSQLSGGDPKTWNPSSNQPKVKFESYLVTQGNKPSTTNIDTVSGYRSIKEGLGE